MPAPRPALKQNLKPRGKRTAAAVERRLRRGIEREEARQREQGRSRPPPAWADQSRLDPRHGGKPAGTRASPSARARRPSPRRPAHPEEPFGRPISVSLSPTPSSSSNGKRRASDPRLRRAEQSIMPAATRSRSKIRSSRSHHPAASDRVAATESRRRQSPRRRSRSRRHRHSEPRQTRDIQPTERPRSGAIGASSSVHKLLP